MLPKAVYLLLDLFYECFQAEYVLELSTPISFHTPLDRYLDDVNKPLDCLSRANPQASLYICR